MTDKELIKVPVRQEGLPLKGEARACLALEPPFPQPLIVLPMCHSDPPTTRRIKKKTQTYFGELIPQTPRHKPFIPVHSTWYSGSAVLKVPRGGTLREIEQ